MNATSTVVPPVEPAPNRPAHGSLLARISVYAGLAEFVLPMWHYQHRSTIAVAPGAIGWVPFTVVYLGPAIMAIICALVARHRNPNDRVALAGLMLGCFVPIVIAVFLSPVIDHSDPMERSSSLQRQIGERWQEARNQAEARTPEVHFYNALRAEAMAHQLSPRDPEMIVRVLHSLPAADADALSEAVLIHGPRVTDATRWDWERAHWAFTRSQSSTFVVAIPWDYDSKGNRIDVSPDDVPSNTSGWRP